MPNITFDKIPLIVSITGSDTVLALENSTLETKRVSISQITEYVSGNLNLTSNPTLSPFDPAQRDVYVNLETGDDTNDGTAGSPLASIQEAVNRFLPAWKEVQTWDLNDDRTIHVVSSSVNTIEENIVIPTHGGEGALIIEAEMEVLHSGLIETGGPFSAVANHEALQEVSFTTSTLTDSDPNIVNNSFLIPRTNLLGNKFEYQWDMLPIRSNTVSSVVVAAAGPGFLTAFSHADSAVVDIKSPLITWKPKTDDLFSYFQKTIIKNFGGPLIVRGFSFDEISGAPAFAAGAVIQNIGSSQYEGYGGKVYVSTCIFKGTQLQLTNGSDDITLSGCIFYGPGCSIRATKICSILNVIADSISGNEIFRIQDTLNVTLFGVYQRGYFFLFGTSVTVNYADIRNRFTLVGNNSRARYDYMTFEDCTGGSSGGAAIEVSENSFLDLANCSGATGNTKYGCLIKNNSSVKRLSATVSVTGDLGDLKVGDEPVTTWTGGNVTDYLSQLARYEG